MRRARARRAAASGVGALFAALFGLAAAHAVGCTQLNASHCANQDGDGTCAAGLFCSKCTAENDGCVAMVPQGCAVDGGETGTPETGSSTSTGLTATSTSGPMTSSTSPATSTGDEATDDGIKMDVPPPCGNGELDEGETCDGNLLMDPDCAALGYSSGALACTEDCEYDVSDCNGDVPCGDGDIDEGEECDSLDFGDQTCEGRRGPNFGGGLHCEPGTCTIDDTTCCKLGGVGCLNGMECCSGKCQVFPLLTCAPG